MLMLFQGIFLLFALLAVFGVFVRARAGELSVRGAAFWVVFWCVAASVVCLPSTATTLAHVFGIGRGADFILYISIAALFFLFFHIQLKLTRVERQITRVVREDALSGGEKRS